MSIEGEDYVRAIELVQHIDQPYEEPHAHYDLAHALYALGDLDGAARHAASMMVSTERSGTRRWKASSLEMNHNVASAKGDWLAARNFSDRSLEWSPEDPPTLLGRAVLEYQTGNFSQGEAYLEQLLSALNEAPPGSLTQSSTCTTPAPCTMDFPSGVATVIR